MTGVKTVYRVDTDLDAPRLELEDSESLPPELLTLDGQPKADVWPNPVPRIRTESLPGSLFVFFRFATGVFVVREDVLPACEDFYWVCREGNELLSLKGGVISFAVVNPIEFLAPPEPTPGGSPCPVDRHYSALFRIEGKPSHEIFCVSGVGNPMNEFKGVYEQYGFTGLRFTEIWRGQ
jgi:hypothetical protein